jgi:hypothetical protein
MKLDRRLTSPLGQAVYIPRIALLLAAVLVFTLMSIVQPPNTIVGPSSAAAHPTCGNKCFAGKYYETLRGCRTAGERALRADPYPNLDWEHYHCRKLPTGEGPMYRLLLWDLGAPG